MRNLRSKLAVAGLILGVVLLFSVNIVAKSVFTGAQWDMTEGRLFTLSDGTRKVLSSIDEPIKIRLLFSKLLGEQSPAHATYFGRVKELLGRYVDLAQGKIVLEVLNPEPFSDAEDMAVAFGLDGVPVTSEGDLGYFGLAAVNSTDDQEVIPFLSPDRETFLEYDLTKLVHGLANPEKMTVGLLTSLPMEGGVGPRAGQTRPWTMVEQIRDFFEVIPVDREAPAVPEEVDVLMVVHPKGLSDAMLHSIDQFVLKGGRALVFVDTNAETAARPGAANVNDTVSEFDRLLEAWGVKLLKDKVAGDLKTARRVNVRVGNKLEVTDYVAWLALSPDHFDSGDIVTADLRRINIATAGILKAVEGKGTQLQALLRTSPSSMAIDREKVMLRPDVVGLFRGFEPSGKPLTLAARISGKPKSAFPDGAPVEDGKKKGAATNGETEGGKASGSAHVAEAAAPINLIVVSDTDLLADAMWVEAQNLFGNTLLVPFANNADFVVNALDNLSGSDGLISLRARTQSHRPFHLVQEIRQDAERRYRVKEQELQRKLTDVRAKLNKLLGRESAGGELVFNTEEKAAVDEFRGEMIAIRKELRDVQHALRRDIETLESWLKFFNIAAIPLIMGFALAIAAAVRRARRKSMAAA